MRPFSVAVLLCMLPACTPASPPAASTPRPPEPEEQFAVLEAASKRAEPVAAAVALSEIGYASVPQISGKARAKNRAALKLHRAEDYVGSRVGFEEALELSPDHDMARFSLACALARLGKLESARTELQTVLHRDLLRFQGRWRGDKADPDLEMLRTSAHAAELDDLVGRLRDAYVTAHERGVAAYLYPRDPIPAETDFAGNPVTQGSSSLIAGAWLHEARRFVPLARGGTVALVDLARRRVLRADVSREEKHCHWDVFASETLTSTDPDPTAEPPGRAYDGASEPQENEYAPPDSPSLYIVDEPAPLVPTWIDVRAYGGVFRAPVPEGYAIFFATAWRPRNRPGESDRLCSPACARPVRERPTTSAATRPSPPRRQALEDVPCELALVAPRRTAGATHPSRSCRFDEKRGLPSEKPGL